MEAKNHEVLIHRLVESGDLSIDNDGRVWRVRAFGEPITPRRLLRRTKLGYLQINAVVPSVGRCLLCLAHRLVWFHFNGPIPEGLTINHKNGDKTDNRPGNLELATRKEQMLHSRDVLKNAHGQRGRQHHEARLSEADVREIRRRYAAGEQQRSIASAFGIHQQQVSKIVTRRRWASVA
jgi:HNH endonuclease